MVGYGYFHEMSGKRDSNPRPSAWEADALPTELLPQYSSLCNLVEIVGVEPTTSCMPCKRSSQLSYTPKSLNSERKGSLFSANRQISLKNKLLSLPAASQSSRGILA